VLFRSQTIKKGTWLMTVEVANDDVWEAIEKGEITGLSMGGVGNYSTKDVELEKAAAPAAAADEVPDKLNLLERLAKALGVESAIVKGEMRDKYEKRVRSEKFWIAFNTLETVLRRWDYWTDEPAYETDEAKVREALEEFDEIIVEILNDNGATITKELHDAHPTDAADGGEDAVEKAGRKMSKANKEKLNGIAQQLIEFAKEFDDEPDDDQDEPDDAETDDKNEDEEETEVNKEDIQKMIDESIQKAMKPADQPAEEQVEKQAETMTEETVKKMIADAIEKATKPVEKQAEEAPAAETLNADAVQKMIEDGIAKAFKQRGLATGMDDGSTGNVEKAETTHYLHGIL